VHYVLCSSVCRAVAVTIGKAVAPFARQVHHIDARRSESRVQLEVRQLETTLCNSIESIHLCECYQIAYCLSNLKRMHCHCRKD